MCCLDVLNATKVAKGNKEPYISLDLESAKEVFRDLATCALLSKRTRGLQLSQVSSSRGEMLLPLVLPAGHPESVRGRPAPMAAQESSPYSPQGTPVSSVSLGVTVAAW